MNFLRGKKKWSIIFGAKNKHVFRGDGKERKHRLEVVLYQMPASSPGIFHLFMRRHMMHLFAFSGANQPRCNVLSRRWLRNRVGAPYLFKRASCTGLTAPGGPRVALKTRHGRRWASLTRSPLPRATGSRLGETPGTWTRVAAVHKNVYFCSRVFSPLGAPCKNTSSEVPQKTGRLSGEATVVARWPPEMPSRPESAKIICIQDGENAQS